MELGDTELDDFLLPMRGVAIKGKIEGTLCILDLELSYLNSDEKQSLECFYEFQVDPDMVIGQLAAKLGEEEIVTEIKEKEKAEQMYEDALAKGCVPLMAQKSSREILRVSLGNLAPLKEAKLSF